MGNSGLLEKSSIPQNILSNSNIGFWAIEIENGKLPRMFVDDIMCELLGINGKKLTPEKIYESWYNNIHPEHYDFVTDAIQKMTNEEFVEVEYPFYHPKKGEIYVRCSGKRNMSYKNIMRFEGCHQDITDLQHIQKESKRENEKSRTLSVINCLADNYDYVGYFNMKTKALIRYHASEVFLNALNKISNTIDAYDRLLKFFATYIYPDDLEYFEKCNSKENITKYLKKEEMYQFEVKIVLNKIPEFYRFKFVNSPDDKHCFVFGILNVNEEIKNELLKIEQDVNLRLVQEEKDTLMKIMDLTEEFESIYDVNLDTGKYSVFTKSGKLTEDIIDNLTFDEDYFISNKKNIPLAIYKDDQEMMLKSMTKENFEKQLSERNSFENDYRCIINGKPYWYKMRIVKIGNWNKERKVRVGLFNNNENYLRNENLRIHLQDEQFYRQAILKDAYSYYKVNLTQNKIISPIIEKDGDKEIDYSNKFGENLSTYDSIIKSSAKIYVDKNFKDSYILSLSRENLINQFNAGNTMPEYVCLIHSFILGWHYRKYVNYLSKDEQNGDILSMTVAYNITEQIKQEEEEKERIEIINALSRDYSAIYYVDLKNDLITPYILNEQNQAEEVNQLNTIHSFEKMLTWFRNNLVHPDDQHLLTDKFYDIIINKKLKESFSLFVRRNYKGSYLYTEVQCVKIGDDKKSSDTFVFALAEKDTVIRAEVEVQEKLKQDIQIINTLASEYSTVMYVNLKNKKLIPYSSNENVSKVIQQFNLNSMKFSSVYNFFVQNIVYEADKKRVLEEGEMSNILEKLKNKKSYEMIFRVKTNRGPEYRQIKYVKVDDKDKEPTAVAIALADRDDEIINQYISNQISNEYSSIYYCDIDTEIVRSIKQSQSIKIGQFVNANINKLISNFIQYISPDYQEEWKNLENVDNIKKFLQNEDTREMTFQIKDVDRPWRRCEWQVIERRNGLPSIIIVFFRIIDDVTAEKLELTNKLEEALSLAQSANRAKTTFLNNMSHDIRTPMNAILGFTNLASSHIDNKNQVLNYLTKIKQSSNHLLSLINDVLDMSRIESGKIILNEKKENLAEILHTLRDIIQADINSKQLNLIIDAEDITDENIICDKLRLNQVLLNILSNSIKYTHPGGTITMSIKENKMQNHNFATFIFTIKDTGIGMSHQFVKTIFDPFTREKSATVSGIQGTGLGMAITKNIIELMDGTITVESEPDVGSKFTVTISLKLDKANNKKTIIKQLKGFRGLVINNDLNICTNTSKMLSELGIRAEISTSGMDAIEKCEKACQEKDEYKIFVIDWLMSDMNGIQTAQKIRQILKSTVPIILLSAYDWSDIENEAINAGINGFVAKPIFISDLREVLSSCCGEKINDNTEISPKEIKGKKILLVEDNEFNQEIAKEILTEAGLVVSIANDGNKAVECIQNSKPGDFDLVLMDIQMPTLDGYEATKLIRQLKNKKLAQIPIIAMTANAFVEDKQKAISYGMNGHIAKPIDIKKLLSVLKEVLGSNN